MPTAGGPNTLGESNLVFAYDTGDVSNSYIGEPTVNLIPSPGLNALPTFGNSWGTYNTNQYCGNNGCGVYWNLATVSGISSNIVTTSTAHGLRTYDVINPETTGGGVTSGTQYFVKAISSTQFTLHAYNGSQDGSQGYINPTTGMFKVHDSVALDQRISINSSGFPTKWFGNPHQPNSGLVKEIIPNGYRNPYTGKLTDCTRIHIPRVDGVDGMAYGSDASVTIGQTYTTSFWVKSVSETAVGRGIYFQHYNYGGPGGATTYATYATLGPVGQWQRVSFSYTVSYNTLISYWFPDGGYIYDFDLANIQIENKTHATQFVAGTRSATQGLFPVIGNSTLDLTNVSFDSNAKMVFDGTNDYVSVTLPSSTSVYCLEMVWYNNNAIPNNDTVIGGPATYQTPIEFNGTGQGVHLGAWTGGFTNEAIHIWGASGATANQVAAGVGYHHVVFNWNGTTYDIWVDGVNTPTQYLSGNNPATLLTASSIKIGNDVSNYAFNGQIPITKIYNRGLSSQEVRQNYQQYKTRFNLS